MRGAAVIIGKIYKKMGIGDHMGTYKIGFIGCGNMAAAIINGIGKFLPGSAVFVYDIDPEKAGRFSGVTVCASIGEVADHTQILFLCVKPNVLPDAAAEIKKNNITVVSIAAGIPVSRLREYIPAGVRLMRVMPNTPMLAGRGAACVQTPNDVPDGEKEFIYGVFSQMGTVAEVAENQMDAVTGVSGSGPAYVYLFIDALARAGEKNGLDYETALTLSVQTFEGAAAMIRQSEKTPSQLIGEVCSPGGTTVEAMKVFEELDVRGVIDRAVSACVRRSGELSR
jgi:pyrroline-5-carboxylate reductase